MKGIILAAGKGTALYPASSHISKTLLPIYDKPMIYYPLSTLMSAGIRDILIVVSREDKSYFKRLLGDGKQFGISVKYAVQKNHRGVVDAILTGERFIDGDMVAVALGDNVFHGEEMYEHLAQAMAESSGASIFCKRVEYNNGFCTVNVDKERPILSLGEADQSEQQLVATGLYIYDKNVCKYAKSLKSDKKNASRSIDAINKIYLEKGELKAEILEEGVFWGETGCFDSLLETSNTIHEIEKTRREIVGCPEEIALVRGFITKRQLIEWINNAKSNPYYDYIRSVVQKENIN